MNNDNRNFILFAVIAVVMALFITYTHRSNIARIRAGTEPRARRLWVLGRGR